MTMIWSQLVYAVPAILVGIFGLVLAIINWSRCPRAALLLVLGVGVLLAATLANALFYGIIAPGFHRSHDAASLGTIPNCLRQNPALSRSSQAGTMSSIAMRVAISDWCASRSMRSVTSSMRVIIAFPYEKSPTL